MWCSDTPLIPAMDRTAKSKEILSKWCSERNVVPEFRFYVKDIFQIKCELTIPGCTYKGNGISKTKNSAQDKAIKNFILFLMRQSHTQDKNSKQMNEETENSEIVLSTIIDKVKTLDLKSVKNDIAAKELKQCNMSNDRNDNNTYCEVAEGSSVIDTPIFVEKPEKKQNKHLIIPESKEKQFLSVHHVIVNENLMNDVYSVLKDYNIPIVGKNTGVMNVNDKLILYEVPKYGNFNTFCGSKVISWHSPRSNWNAWTSLWICQDDSLADISNELKKKFANKQSSVTLQERIKDRAKLPIFNKKDEILDIIRDNPVVIVQGGTGSGKTTQVCQFILDEYIQTKKGAHCNIICVQPRKIPAISLANRVAYERAEVIGESVGYAVRFDFVNPQPFGSILYCTVEILIRKLKKGLFGISHVIVDEVHERHADCEFLLIILKDMVQKYSNLRVILMSANVNLKLFCGYFNNCPVINVEGRCHPIKEYFLEDIVQMLNYVPDIKDKTQMKKKNEQVNCNLLVSDDYSDEIKQRVSMIGENNYHLRLVQSLLTYIETNLNTIGAVIIFLPGWYWIKNLRDYLLRNKFIGIRN